MIPVLFSIGNIAVSSFGVFLALGFLVGVFLIWRLSRAWDLDEEQILDITLVTFLGGLIGARIYFVLNNFQFFSQNILGIILVHKFPGFSFWGAILGSWLTLFFFTRKRREDFLQLGDIAAVGFLGGLIFSSLGCFLGGCDLGIKSNLPFAVEMVGVLGKRFPTQAVEASLLLLVLWRLWSQATHFHPRGKILSLSLIYIGAIKFLLEPLKQSRDEGQFLSLVLLILGITIFYKVTQKNPVSDLKHVAQFVLKLFTDPISRKYTMARIQKYWYNQTTLISWKFRNLKRDMSLKKVLRRFNVRVSDKND